MKDKWSVENEDNNTLYYEVQSGTDGRNFKVLSKINANRDGLSSGTYTSTDFTISRYANAFVYYRIVQVEADGSPVYSEIRKVSLDKKAYTIGLFPNQVQSTTRLVIETTEAGKTLIIRDATGKTVQQSDWQLAPGTNQKELNVSVLPAGSYLLSVSSENGTETVRFEKW